MPEPTEPPRTQPTDPSAARPAAGPSDRSLRPDPTFWGEERTRRHTPPRPALARGLGALRDRLDEWRSDARLGIVALVVVAVVAGVIWYRIGVSGGSEDAPSRSTTPAPASSSGAAPTTTLADVPVIVHVAGAVTRPGVVELPAGSRVIDAVEAVGGGLPDAALDGLNLAAKLADGQRVLVPRVGEPVPAGQDPASGAPGAVDGGVVDVNTATGAQLEELPGIGPVLAQAIIDERERRGGFRSVNELRDVRGIGEKRFADLRDRVRV